MSIINSVRMLTFSKRIPRLHTNTHKDRYASALISCIVLNTPKINDNFLSYKPVDIISEQLTTVLNVKADCSTTLLLQWRHNVNGKTLPRSEGMFKRTQLHRLENSTITVAGMGPWRHWQTTTNNVSAKNGIETKDLHRVSIGYDQTQVSK